MTLVVVRSIGTFSCPRVAGISVSGTSSLANKIDAGAIELLATRTVILGEYMAHFPNIAANKNDATKAKWKQWSKETLDLSKQLVEESSKGKKASEAQLLGLLKKLNANCSACHKEFRD